MIHSIGWVNNKTEEVTWFTDPNHQRVATIDRDDRITYMNRRKMQEVVELLTQHLGMDNLKACEMIDNYNSKRKR